MHTLKLKIQPVAGAEAKRLFLCIFHNYPYAPWDRWVITSPHLVTSGCGWKGGGGDRGHRGEGWLDTRIIFISYTIYAKISAT